MQSRWLEMEYYRLDCVEAWAEGPRKQATRAAILSAIASLSGNAQAEGANTLSSSNLTRCRPVMAN
jgi:hypothetical protein